MGFSHSKYDNIQTPYDFDYMLGSKVTLTIKYPRENLNVKGYVCIQHYDINDVVDYIVQMPLTQSITKWHKFIIGEYNNNQVTSIKWDHKQSHHEYTITGIIRGAAYYSTPIITNGILCSTTTESCNRLELKIDDRGFIVKSNAFFTKITGNQQIA